MAGQNIRILVVEADPQVCQLIVDHLDPATYDIEYVSGLTQTLHTAEEFHPQFVLLDLETVGIDRFDILNKLKTMDRNVAIIALSGSHHSTEVREVLNLGVEDFIAKPFDPSLIEISMKNIREKRSLREQVSRLKKELERDHAFGMLVGETPPIIALREFIHQVADTDLNILIRGESGTGKDVTSRLIHQLSSRREGPFVKVNCAALPDNLIESELFGYEKGAFTGAVRAKPGRFQLAHGGTIFLDEITEIPFPLQSKLLQVLEQREFVSVGGTRNIRVDCRCIAATNAKIEQLLASQRFREDLYFRLNEFSVSLPALRERPDDIPLLIDYFLSLYSERYQRKRKPIPPEAVRAMMEYPWPGNVRELESLLKRVIVLDNEEIIYQTIGDYRTRGAGNNETHNSGPHPYSFDGSKWSLAGQNSPTAEGNSPETGGNDPDTTPVSENKKPNAPPLNPPDSVGLKTVVERAIEVAERTAILDTLHRTKWNRRKAASQLGISYSSLLRRIERYNLEAHS